MVSTDANSPVLKAQTHEACVALNHSSASLRSLSDGSRVGAVTHSDSLCKTLYLVCKGYSALLLKGKNAVNVRNFPLAVRNFLLAVRNFPCHPQLDCLSSSYIVRTQ